MKALVVIILVSSVSLALGRSVQGGDDVEIDPSRNLKGVLKFYKDQPRVTDSESIEFEEVDSQVPVNDDKLEQLQQKNTVEHQTKTKYSGVQQPSKTAVIEPNVELDDSERHDETTILPQKLEDETLGQVSSMSKSDLYEDDLDENDDCMEGDVMKVSCNTCVCSEGKYFCSKRDCSDKQIPLPPLEKPSSKRKGTIIKYHSVKGDANKAVVVNASSTEVAGNATTFEVSEVDPSQCIDGRTKPVDCNQCVCALGKWACTKMSCIALSLREKASFSGDEFLKSVGTLKEYANIDEDCMEGEAKQMGCNQCVCHMNSWACSDFTCPSTAAPPKPENVQEACQTEEDVKSKDCNICSCRRGVWVCTKNDCKKFGNRYFNPVNQKHHSAETE